MPSLIRFWQRYLQPPLDMTREGRVERPLGGWMSGYLLWWGETWMKAEQVKRPTWVQVDWGERGGPRARWQVQLGPVTFWARGLQHYGWEFRLPVPTHEGRVWLQQDWEWYWYGPLGWHTTLTIRSEVHGWMGVETQGEGIGVEVGRGVYVRLRLIRGFVAAAVVAAVAKGLPWLLRLGGNPPVPEMLPIAP